MAIKKARIPSFEDFRRAPSAGNNNVTISALYQHNISQNWDSIHNLL
jgi:hypothetical protein